MKLKLFLISVFIVLLSLVAYQAHTSFRPNIQNKTIVENSCSELNVVIDTLTSNIPRNIHYAAHVYNNEPNRMFMWRSSNNLPVFSYLGETSRTFNLPAQPLSISNKLVQTEIIPKLRSLGFTLDNSDLNVPEWENVQYYYGLDKNNTHYSIHLAEAISDMSISDQGDLLSEPVLLPEGSSSISLVCGQIDDQLNRDIYQKIQSVANYSRDTVVSKIDILDDVVLLDITSLGSLGGGHAEYWVIRNGLVKKIGAGQDTPPCEMFEAIKAGRGYACYDISKSITRAVSY